MQIPGVTAIARLSIGEPLLKRGRHLIFGLLMAAETGIGVLQLTCLQWVWRGEAVVMAQVVGHVQLAGHMATDTLASRRASRMVVMGGMIIVPGLQPAGIDAGPGGLAGRIMALGADGIDGGPQLDAVGIVTVRTDHPGGVHPALLKRAVLEHFVLDLAVYFIQVGAEDHRQVIIQQLVAMGVAIVQRHAAAVAAGTGFRLAGGAHQIRLEAPPVRSFITTFRPLEMAGCRAMAALTAHPQCLPLAGIGIVYRVVIALETGGVTFNAHEVGILLRPAPVQAVLVIHRIAVVQMKPALLGHIPGSAVGLQAAVVQLQEVLLQRLNTESVSHRMIGGLAFGIRSIDPETTVTAEEAAGFSIAGQGLLVEVAQHRIVVGRLHGQLVVRVQPVGMLLGVAALATGFIHPLRAGRGSGGRRRLIVCQRLPGSAERNKRYHQPQTAFYHGLITALVIFQRRWPMLEMHGI